MKKRTACLAAVFAVAGFVVAQDQDEKKEPVTISKALAVGEEGITQYTGLSEVGQDEAAELFAAATRLTTEQTLGQKDLKLVLELENWRNLLSACRRSIDSLAYFVNGGGTMYSHGERREVSAVETFLAEFSKGLPIPDGKGDLNADKVIDRTIALLKSLKATGDSKHDISEGVKNATAKFADLKTSVGGIPPDQAKKLVMFATDGISGWLLDDDNAEAKKFDKLRETLKK